MVRCVRPVQLYDNGHKTYDITVRLSNIKNKGREHKTYIKLMLKLLSRSTALSKYSTAVPVRIRICDSFVVLIGFWMGKGSFVVTPGTTSW